MWSLCGVYVESMKTPHGVQRDCLKYRGLHEDSMKHCFMDSTETLRGLLVDSQRLSMESSWIHRDSPWTPHRLSVDSPWTPHRLSEDSKGTASLIYLIKKELPAARVEPGTFRSVII